MVTDSSGRRVPDFWLIGVPRSGSTSLYHALGEHPAIFVPSLKELCFPSSDIDPGTRRTDTVWIADRDAYLEFFRPAGPQQLVGEGCVYNIYSPAAPVLIRDLNPAARILVALRDPVEQMHSNHALKWIMGDVHERDFRTVVESQIARRATRTQPPRNLAEYDLLDKASVSSALERFVDVFGHEHVHVSLYDDYALDAPGVLAGVFHFLGVDPAFDARPEVRVPNRAARWDGLNRAMASPRLIARAKQIVPRALHPAASRLAHGIFGHNGAKQPARRLTRRCWRGCAPRCGPKWSDSAHSSART